MFQFNTNSCVPDILYTRVIHIFSTHYLLLPILPSVSFIFFYIMCWLICNFLFSLCDGLLAIVTFQLSQQSDGSLSSSVPASVIQQGPSSLNSGATSSVQEGSQPNSNGEASSDGGGRQSPTLNIPPPTFSAKCGHTLSGTGRWYNCSYVSSQMSY
jgi:hypothetical protein